MLTILIDLDDNSCTLDGSVDNPDSFYLDIYYRFEPASSQKNLNTRVKNFKVEPEIRGPNNENIGVEIVAPGGDDENIGEPMFIDTRLYTNLFPGSIYYLNLKIFNLRKVKEHSFEIHTPKPEKPFNSWIWNDEKKLWAPPKEKPELIWNEESQSWNLP